MAERKIDLDSLPSNKIGADDDPDRPVTLSGNVRTKAPNYGFAKDVRDIANTLFAEVISPNIRMIIGEFVTSAIELMLWGDRPSRFDRREGPRDYTRYSKPRSSMRRGGDSRRHTTRVAGVTRSPELKEIFFEYKDDADLVLAELLDRVDEYGWVSVGDLYALSGISSSHNDEMYGWYRLDRVRVSHTHDGYILNLPRPAYRN